MQDDSESNGQYPLSKVADKLGFMAAVIAFIFVRRMPTEPTVSAYIYLAIASLMALLAIIAGVMSLRRLVAYSDPNECSEGLGSIWGILFGVSTLAFTVLRLMGLR